MWNTRRIINKQTGAGVPGLIVKLYALSPTPPYYTGSALYEMEDLGVGLYAANITNTFSGTLVIERGSTDVVPSNFVGYEFKGDDSPMTP